MSLDTRRLAGLLGGSAAGAPFAIAAASYRAAGMAVGAAVTIATVLIGADGVVWPLALWSLARRQQRVRPVTSSVEDTLRLDESARQTLEVIVRARAGLSDNPTPCNHRRRDSR